MSGKRDVATLSISATEMERLEEIAEKLDCKWGEKGNVSEMMRQIADGKLVVVSKQSQISSQEKLSKAIGKCFAALIEIQQILFGG